ncbi:MAG: D-aminoacyl-tRNA deacylase [Crocinitomicaceae bacterium]
MRVLIQRVLKAEVFINETSYSKIQKGLLILVGIEHEDVNLDADYLVQKITNLRIFEDDQKKMNHNIKEVNGELMVISQFTLHAKTKKGNRPSFIKAAPPEQAIPLYNYFCEQLDSQLDPGLKTGEFGADMQVQLINDGPVTLLLDSKDKK